MSVAFHIPNSPDSTYVPVSSEAFFNKYWVEKSDLEELEFIPRFGIGIDVDSENLPIIISELEKLKNRVPEYSDVPYSEKLQWMERISTLIDTLKRFLEQEDFHGYIG